MKKQPFAEREWWITTFPRECSLSDESFPGAFILVPRRSPPIPKAALNDFRPDMMAANGRTSGLGASSICRMWLAAAEVASLLNLGGGSSFQIVADICLYPCSFPKQHFSTNPFTALISSYLWRAKIGSNNPKSFSVHLHCETRGNRPVGGSSRADLGPRRSLPECCTLKVVPRTSAVRHSLSYSEQFTAATDALPEAGFRSRDLSRVFARLKTFSARPEQLTENRGHRSEPRTRAIMKTFLDSTAASGNRPLPTRPF